MENNTLRFDGPSFFILSFLDKIVLYALVFGLCFDLSGHFGIRSVFVFPSAFYLLVRNFKDFKDNNKFFFLIFLFIIFPILGFFRTFLTSIPNEFVTSQLMATLQIPFLYICLKKTSGKVLLKVFVNSLFALQVIGIILFFGGLIGNTFITNIIHLLGSPFDGSYFGFLRIGNFTLPQIYFKSTLFFVFTAVYFFSKKNYIKSLISISVLILSVSKAGAVLAFFGILILIVKRRKIKDLLFITIGFLLMLYFGDSYYQNYMELSDSYTLKVRVLQWSWFKLWIVENPFDFLLGMGLGRSINIPNYGIATAIELEHLDVIRKYGVLWFIAILYSIFSIVRKSFYNKDFGITIAYIMTFIAVGTNPVFITSLFFMLSLILYKLNYDI